MRYIAFAFFVGLAFPLAANDLFAAGVPTVGHGSGAPATGSQNGFGRTGTTPPNFNSGFSPAPSTSSPINTAAPTLNSPSAGGTAGTSSSGLPSAGGFGAENNAYPMTNPRGGGLAPEAPASASSNASGSQGAANQANATSPSGPNLRDMRYFGDRWWYPLASGHWVYWDGSTSSWIFFSPASTALAESTPPSGQYSSGYRGLGGAAANAPAASPIEPTGWYWRSGAWYWFDGRTFRAATAAK